MCIYTYMCVYVYIHIVAGRGIEDVNMFITTKRVLMVQGDFLRIWRFSGLLPSSRAGLQVFRV